MIFDFSDDFKSNKAAIPAVSTSNNRKRREYEGRSDRSPLKALKLNDNNIIQVPSKESGNALTNYIVSKESIAEKKLIAYDINEHVQEFIINDTSSSSSSDGSKMEYNDLSSWVSNELLGLGLGSLNPDQADTASLTIIQKLLAERARYQRQSSDLSSENSRLRGDIGNKEADKEKDLLLQNALSQDVKNLTNKIGVMIDEHRVAKNHWLSEKNELLSRCLQIQALHTQSQGSLRKKEKEYDHLHQQLEKIVTKEAVRQSKGSTMVISKPLQRNLSQASSKASIKEAELYIKEQSMLALEEENVELRGQLDQVRADHQVNHRELEETIQQLEEKLNSSQLCWMEEKNMLSAQLADTVAINEKMHIEEAIIEQKRLVAAEVEETLASLRQAQYTIRQQDALIRRALFGKLPSYASSGEMNDDDMEANAEDLTSLHHISTSTRILRSASKRMSSSQPINATTTASAKKRKSSRSASFKSPVKAISSPPRMNELDADRIMRDFLPPASPATLEVLKGCGWTDLPSLM